MPQFVLFFIAPGNNDSEICGFSYFPTSLKNFFGKAQKRQKVFFSHLKSIIIFIIKKYF